MRTKNTAKKRKGMSLSTMLWLGFSLFAVAVVFIFSAVQGVMLYRQYKTRTVSDLRAAGNYVMQELVSDGEWKEERLNYVFYDVLHRYSVNVFLLKEDGTCHYPYISVGFNEEVSVIQEKLRESGGISIVYQQEADVYSYASSLVRKGEVYYVYATRSPQSVGMFFGEIQGRSLTVSILAIVLAFVVSGFISMLLTKSLTEVTQKAKGLASGDYDQRFYDGYHFTEINELSETLDFAREEISKADNMQKELIANVSHDFKTPLTMIKAYASMIQEISGEDPQKRKAHTQVIIDESDRLTALVNDILDISKIRSGVDELKKGVFNLSEYLFGVVAKFDYLAETKGYRLETEIDDELYTLADKEKIGQVLYNLIGNAVNYTGDDKRVTVRLKRSGRVSRLEVVDTGKGIADEELAGIWDRYYRSSETHKRPVKGTGLGLSIVKTVLDRHKFRFGVLSQVGKGSCFWVEFPLPKDDFEVN